MAVAFQQTVFLFLFALETSGSSSATQRPEFDLVRNQNLSNTLVSGRVAVFIFCISPEIQSSGFWVNKIESI